MTCYCRNCDDRTDDMTVSEWLNNMAFNDNEIPTVRCKICKRELESQYNMYEILLSILEKLEENKT